jgi:3-hydroxy-9,10-secoandrosta-1,3,5(10)-triene-9,17-dione monooxygenase
MTILSSTPDQDSPAPPEPGLTPAEVIGRAEAIAPALAGRQAETERRTFYGQDVHEQFTQAGFYRLLVPRRYGGYEFGIETFLKVVTILARGCPSTAWMYCLGAAHALVAATLFDERAQEEIFAGGDFICPAIVVPGGQAERTDDGHWLIKGTWGYCSGSPYATHLIAHTLIAPEAPGQPPTPMVFVVPRDQWRRLDDWGDQLGLKGSGSHSIAVDARIPDHYTVPGVHLSTHAVDAGTAGRTLHGNPLYGGGPASFMVLEIASLAVGIAQGALDAYEDLLRTRMTQFPPFVSRSQDPDYQSWHGEAAGMITTAEAAVRGAIAQWNEITEAGPAAFTREHDLRLALVCRNAIRLCWDAVELYLFRTAGSSSVRHGERIERVWRDLSMLHNHAGLAVLLPTMAMREYSVLRSGGQAVHQ